MKIRKTYSHMNGLEWLKVHRSSLWSEIQSVIASVDANQLKTKISKETRMAGQRLFSPPEINNAISKNFYKIGWKKRTSTFYVPDNEKLIREVIGLPPKEQKILIESRGYEAIRSSNEIDFLKNEVSVEVQLGKYSFIEYDMFVKHLAFYVNGEIRCGVEIVPTKVMQREMSSGPGYYERALYSIIRQGRGTPSVPLVLLGVEP